MEREKETLKLNNTGTPIEIPLYNRDGADLRLIPLDDKSVSVNKAYILDVDKKHSYVLDYTTVTGDFYIKDHIANWLCIEAVDPSGGPYLYIGYELPENWYIKNIVSTVNCGTVFIIDKHEAVDQ